MDYQDIDLLGDPVPANFKGRGRPPHTPTEESWLRVNMLWADDCNNEECAKALGISEPTFNRHYFKKSARKAAREEAALKVRAETLAALMRQVREGNVSAMDKLLKRLDRNLMRTKPGPGKAKPKKGKKQTALEDAPAAHEGTSWENILNQRPN